MFQAELSNTSSRSALSLIVTPVSHPSYNVSLIEQTAPIRKFPVRDTENNIKVLTALVGRLSLSAGLEDGPKQGL